MGYFHTKAACTTERKSRASSAARRETHIDIIQLVAQELALLTYIRVQCQSIGLMPEPEQARIQGCVQQR